MAQDTDNSTCPIDFSTKKCKPCQGGIPPLSLEEAQKNLVSLKGWELAEASKIKKEFKFKDFAGSLEFVNQVGSLAEAEGHHPVILINYNKVRISLTTHKIGGLSENDFIMAAKIGNLTTA